MTGLGYNAMLVAAGATLLGASAGVTGTFLYLRKRALIADAISHSTLPGVALAFLAMVALGGDGRNLAGLLAGSALSAVAGLLSVQWLTRRTRLPEDAAIGAVLSVYFGAGVVLLTVIQTMEAGRQAGLGSLLLGATAGMLRADALLIAGLGALTLALVLILRRPMQMVAFDAGHAASMGLNVARVDLAIMGLVLAVTVVGLKIVGLVLIVALLIVPPAAARFWSDRVMHVALVAGGIGGGAGLVGTLISASAPALPTGPLIVLVAFALFVMSLLLAPRRGLLAGMQQRIGYRRALLRRQGLLCLARGLRVQDRATRHILRQAGLARRDGAATERGWAEAASVARDTALWEAARAEPDLATVTALDDGVTPIRHLVTRDQLARLEARLDAGFAGAGEAI